MTLQYRHAQIALTGLDTKTDDKNVIDGKLILAENVLMQKTGKLESRPGYSRLGSTTYTEAISLATLGKTYAVVQQNGIVNYPESGLTGAVLPLATGRHVPVECSVPLRNFSSFDCAMSSTQMATAIRSYTGVLTVTVYDTASGLIIQKTAVNAATRFKIAIGEAGKIFVLYYNTDSSAWKLLVLPSGVEYAATPLAGWTNTSNIDIAAFSAVGGGDDCALIQSRQSDGQVVLSGFQTSDNTWYSSTTLRGAGAATTLPPAIYVGQGKTASRLCVGYQESSNHIRGGVSGTLLEYTAVTAVAESLQITVVEDATDLYIADEYYLGGFSGDTAIGLFASTVDVYRNGTLLKQNLGVVLTQKGFTERKNTTAIIPMMTEGVTGQILVVVENVEQNWNRFETVYVAVSSTAQTPWFAFGLQQTWPIFSKTTGLGYAARASERCTPWSGTGKVVYPDPQSVIVPTEGIIRAAAFMTDATGTGEIQSPHTISYEYQGFTNAWGNVAILGGESAMTEYPRFVNVPISPPQVYYKLSAAGGSMPSGTYQVLVVFEGVDTKGNRYWSLPTSFVFTHAAGSTNKMELYIRSPDWYYANSGGTCKVYMSEANGTILYRRNGIPSTDGTALSYLSPPDTTLPIWPFGASLEPSFPPVSSALGFARNRFWLCNASQGTQLWFSKAVVTGEMPQFSEALTLSVPSSGGRVQAIAEMDDKVVIFKETEIYATYGDGPDETGASLYPTPQRITQTLGCRDPRSVVLTDAGLMFKSHEGIYLLSRGLQLAYVGKDVEAYNASLCVDAINLVETHRIMFFHTDGNTLLWDEFHNLWTVNTGQTAQCAAILPNRKPAFLRVGQLLYEDSTKYTDNGTQYGVRIRTGWIAVGQVQGFQRVRAVTWLGTINASDTQSMTVAYDYGAASETFTASAAVVGTPYQWQGRPARQKCEAFQLTLSMAALTSQVTLSGFALEMGIKNGTNRLPATKRVQGV